MRRSIAVLLLLASMSGDSAALDVSDVATYRFISIKNEPTQKLMRLAGGPGAWRVEDRLPDGSWRDVACQGVCKLQESNEDDLKRFFPADDLSTVEMTCVHNIAFAICKYSLKSAPAERGYVFVALTEMHPIPLRLWREK